jgi:hypothetical protein
MVSNPQAGEPNLVGESADKQGLVVAARFFGGVVLVFKLVFEE